MNSRAKPVSTLVNWNCGLLLPWQPHLEVVRRLRQARVRRRVAGHLPEAGAVEEVDRVAHVVLDQQGPLNLEKVLGIPEVGPQIRRRCHCSA